MDGQSLHRFALAERHQNSAHRFTSIYACLQPPSEVNFNVHSFGDERDGMDARATETWNRLSGIDAFLEWQMAGYVSYPECFGGTRATLLINPLGSSDRFQNSERGIVGDGFSDPDFVFRLYLPLDVTQALLRHVRAVGDGMAPTEADMLPKARNRQSQNDWQDAEHGRNLLRALENEITGHNPDFFNIRFDLINIAYYDRPRWTGFDVCRIYS